jgi:hypothetical protein
MTTLSQHNSGEKLHLTVPYILNPAFKEVFKTATWNSTRKVYEVKDTTQNRNKWTKFLAMAHAASQALAQVDQQEATAEELKRAAARLADVLETCRYRLEDAEKTAEIAKAQTLRLGPLLEAAKVKLAEVEASTAKATAKRDAVIAPALSLYEKHGLDHIISDYLAGARRGYLGKTRCETAETRLIPLKKALQQVGFEVAAINTLVGTSLNNAPKLLEAAEALQRTKLTGIKAYTPREN